jgi:phage-related protein
MSIGNAISDLVSSFVELISSILTGIYNTIHAIFAAVLGLFSGFINLIGDVTKGAVDVVGGLGKFLASKSARTPTTFRLATMYCNGGFANDAIFSQAI